MIEFPVLIPGQNFLFPGTGREITKCHGKGNLRLVFPGIMGNRNSRSPLSHINEHKGLVRGSILWGIGTKCRGGCLDDGDYFLVFNQHCWLSRERGCGGSLVCHSMSSPSLATQSTFWTGESVHCVSDPTILSSQWKAARPHLLPTILLPIPDPPYNSQCIPTNPPTAIYRVNIESILKAHSRTPRLQGGTLPLTLWLTFTANQTHFVSWYTIVTAIIYSSKDLRNSQAI